MKIEVIYTDATWRHYKAIDHAVLVKLLYDEGRRVLFWKEIENEG